jgi:hypothetical protein
MGSFSIYHWLIFLAFAAVVVKVLARLPARPSAEGRMICPACGTRGEPKTITRGSLRIEILLWLLLIVPGVIYSLWRLTTRAEGCPACGQIGMIPVATPRGQQLLDGHK